LFETSAVCEFRNVASLVAWQKEYAALYFLFSQVSAICFEKSTPRVNAGKCRCSRHSLFCNAKKLLSGCQLLHLDKK